LLFGWIAPRKSGESRAEHQKMFWVSTEDSRRVLLRAYGDVGVVGIVNRDSLTLTGEYIEVSRPEAGGWRLEELGPLIRPPTNEADLLD
jgi:hypothetical protein